MIKAAVVLNSISLCGVIFGNSLIAYRNGIFEDFDKRLVANVQEISESSMSDSSVGVESFVEEQSGDFRSFNEGIYAIKENFGIKPPVSNYFKKVSPISDPKNLRATARSYAEKPIYSRKLLPFNRFT